MYNHCELNEYDEILIQGYELTLEERTYLQTLSTIKFFEQWEKRFYFDELKTGLRIQSTSWVGVIELEKARVSIRPKFDHGFKSLLRMVSFVDKLPFHKWHNSAASWDSL